MKKKLIWTLCILAALVLTTAIGAALLQVVKRR